MSPEENRPPLAPSDFAKILLNQVVGNSENPNNLSSANVLQLVRQGVQKPGFMEEYLKSGGVAPQYSVLTDSEYMDAYRTDQVPDLRPQPGQFKLYSDSDSSQPTPATPAVESLPTGGGSGYSPVDSVPYVPPVDSPVVQPVNPVQTHGDPTNYQNSLGPNRTDGLNPATGQPYPDFNFLKTLSNMGMQQQNGSSPPSVSEDLLQGNFQSPLPMYSSPPAYNSPPAQQGYNYNPDVMAKLLQQLTRTQI